MTPIEAHQQRIEQCAEAIRKSDRAGKLNHAERVNIARTVLNSAMSSTEERILSELRASVDGQRTWDLMRQDYRVLLDENRSLRRKIDLWGTPTTSSGAFPKDKASGDVFRGSRREDRWSFWDAFDSLHKSLLFLLAIATAGLVLHAVGVFC